MGLFGTTFDWKPKPPLPPEQMYPADQWYRDPVSKVLMPYEQSTLNALFQGQETVPTIGDWARGYMYPTEGMQIDLVTQYTHPMQYARRETGLHAWGDFLTPLLLVGGPIIGSQFAAPISAGGDAGVNAGVFTAGELAQNEAIAAQFGMSSIGPTVATGAEVSIAEEFGMAAIGPTVADAGEIATVGAGAGEIGGNVDLPFGADYAGEPLTNSGAGATPAANYLSTTKDILTVGAMGKSLFSGATKLLDSGKSLINEIFGGGVTSTPGNISMGGESGGGGFFSAKTLPWFLIGFVLIGALILKGRK